MRQMVNRRHGNKISNKKLPEKAEENRCFNSSHDPKGKPLQPGCCKERWVPYDSQHTEQETHQGMR